MKKLLRNPKHAVLLVNSVREKYDASVSLLSRFLVCLKNTDEVKISDVATINACVVDDIDTYA